MVSARSLLLGVKEGRDRDGSGGGGGGGGGGGRSHDGGLLAKKKLHHRPSGDMSPAKRAKSAGVGGSDEER